MAKMNVLGTEISVVRINDDDYISLTDMVHNIENGEFFIGRRSEGRAKACFRMTERGEPK